MCTEFLLFMFCSGLALPLWLLLTSQAYCLSFDINKISCINAWTVFFFSSNFTYAWCDCAVVVHMTTNQNLSIDYIIFFWWQKMFFSLQLVVLLPACPSFLSGSNMLIAFCYFTHCIFHKVLLLSQFQGLSFFACLPASTTAKSHSSAPCCSSSSSVIRNPCVPHASQ